MDSASLELRKCGPILAQIGVFFLIQYEGSDRKHVHPRPQEAVDGLRRRFDDRLILIKGSIQENRYTGQFLELSNSAPIARIHFALHGLEPSRAVAVRYRGNRLT